MSNSIEQLLRARLGTLLSAVNDINSLGFFNVYPTPPPNWPCPKSITVEIESESPSQADDSEGKQQEHASARKIIVKVACVWGDVDPTTLAQSIEEKVFTIRDAIEQSLWLIDEYHASPLIFSRINITGVYKKYAPAGYMEAGVIVCEFIKHQTWTRDDSLAMIFAPDLFTIPAGDITDTSIKVTWKLPSALGVTGIRVYKSLTDVKPLLATATLAVIVDNYTFAGLTHTTQYHFWIEVYNGMMAKNSYIKETTSHP